MATGTTTFFRVKRHSRARMTNLPPGRMTFDDWQGDATFAPWRPDVNRTFFAKRQPRSLVVLIVLRRCGWRQFVLQSRRPATTTRLLSGSARSTRRRGPAWCRLSCKRPRTHNAYSHIPVICNANSDLRPASIDTLGSHFGDRDVAYTQRAALDVGEHRFPIAMRSSIGCSSPSSTASLTRAPARQRWPRTMSAWRWSSIGTNRTLRRMRRSRLR